MKTCSEKVKEKSNKNLKDMYSAITTKKTVQALGRQNQTKLFVSVA